MLAHPIKTIIFDLDGTLRHNVPSADDFQYKYARQLGIKNRLASSYKEPVGPTSTGLNPQIFLPTWSSLGE